MSNNLLHFFFERRISSCEWTALCSGSSMEMPIPKSAGVAYPCLRHSWYNLVLRMRGKARLPSKALAGIAEDKARCHLLPYEREVCCNETSMGE